MKSWLAWLGLSLVIAALAWTMLPSRPLRHDEAAVADRPREVLSDDYVSSDTCRSCHPSQHATWSSSYHRSMTQVATPASVVAPFDVTIAAFGGEVHLSREGDRYFAEMPDPLWMDRRRPPPRVKRPLVLTTGSHHEQDFWFPEENGRSLALLPLVYRIAERRWVPYGSTLLAPPQPLHEPITQELGAWNRNCMQCHTTFPRPRIDWERGVDTQVAEFGIACEACHGPGLAHVRRQRNPLRRYLEHLRDAADPTIVNPARLTPQRSSEVCGQCHMVSTVLGPATHPEWNESGPTYRPGDDLASSRDIVAFDMLDRPIMQKILRMEPNFMQQHFWSDGMIRVSGREYHGLRESPCFQRGEMSCLSCHTMHRDPSDTRPSETWADDQLIVSLQGDESCLQCHRSLGERLAEHSHHAPESSGSRCLNCHMPHTSYGLLKAIRSHQIDVPEVAATLATGRPNACTLCHLDRSLGWAADRLHEWYGQERPLLAAPREQVSATVLDLLRGDAGQRALAAWTLGWDEARAASAVAGDGAWSVPLLAELLVDPYDAVRFIAERSLRQTLAGDDFDYDFVGSPESRAAARQRILDDWHEREDRRLPLDPAGVLLRLDGERDEEQVRQLLAERDDRPIFLNE